MEIKEINAEIENINSQLKARAVPTSEFTSVMKKKDELVKARVMYYIGLCPSIEVADRGAFYSALQKKYYGKKKESLTEEDIWNKSIDYYVGDFS